MEESWLTPSPPSLNHFLTIAGVILSFSHFHLAFGWGNPVVPLTGIGIGYSIVAGVVWPSVVCVVDPTTKGAAFGMLTSLQNFCQVGLGPCMFTILLKSMK